MGNSNVEIGFNAANTAFLYGGSTLNSAASFTDGSWHALQGLYAGGSSVINADGTDGAAAAGGANPIIATTNATAIGSSGAGDNFTGLWLESGQPPPGSTTTAQRNAVCHNQNVAWSLGLPC